MKELQILTRNDVNAIASIIITNDEAARFEDDYMSEDYGVLRVEGYQGGIMLVERANVVVTVIKDIDDVDLPESD